MIKDKRYVGLDKDRAGVMTPTGNIIRDAWVFGLIPETETCEGWTIQGIEDLYDKVLDVNLKGPFRLSALVGTRMAGPGHGGGRSGPMAWREGPGAGCHPRILAGPRTPRRRAGKRATRSSDDSALRVPTPAARRRRGG